MSSPSLKTILKKRHEIVAWLVGSLIFILMLSQVIYQVFTAGDNQETPQEQSNDHAPLPSTTKPREDGCIEMPDGILICDHAMSKRTSNTSILTTNANLRGFGGFQHICSLSGHPKFKSASNLRDPKPEAMNALKWMVDRVGISANFKILAADFHNASSAFASIRGKHRYIVYDAKKYFISNHKIILWKSAGILGHELGHHLAGHTKIHNQPNHTRELEADKFSGFILARLGATQRQAAIWTDSLSLSGSTTHPPRAKRKQAAIDGWKLANKFNTQTASTCSTAWIGESFEVETKDCRIAKRCVNGKQQVQLACEQDIDQWQWVN